MTMCSSTLVYVIDPIDECPDRLSFTFTLLLTAVAFQLTIQGTLPNVSCAPPRDLP